MIWAPNLRRRGLCCERLPRSGHVRGFATSFHETFGSAYSHQCIATMPVQIYANTGSQSSAEAYLRRSGLGVTPSGGRRKLSGLNTSFCEEGFFICDASAATAGVDVETAFLLVSAKAGTDMKTCVSRHHAWVASSAARLRCREPFWGHAHEDNWPLQPNATPSVVLSAVTSEALPTKFLSHQQICAVLVRKPKLAP